MSVEISYGQRSENLTAALGEMVKGVGKETKTIVLGSLGKRLSVAVEVHPGITLTGYFETAESTILAPRFNERGKWDADIGVPDIAISWSELASLAKQITSRYDGVEIDPHLMKLENGRAKMRGSWRNGGYKIDMPLHFAEVNLDEGNLLVPELPEQVAYTLSYSCLRPKDIPELEWTMLTMMMCPELIKEGDTRMLGVAVLGCLGRPGFYRDMMLLPYRILPNKMKRKIRKLMRGQEDSFSFNSPDPVYF